jgi:5-methylcytosine-specific restriction endonuclease McrA
MAKSYLTKGVIAKAPHIRAYDLWKHQRGRCFWCDEPITDLRQLTVDHLLPKAFSGPDCHYNLVACCVSCNQMMAATSLKMKIAWMKSYIRIGIR